MAEVTSDPTGESGAPFDSKLVRGRLAWLALALYGAVGLVSWLRAEWRPEWDSALYLLLAESLAAGMGYVYLDEPFFLRPPGFSWLLSGVLKAVGHDELLLNRLIWISAVLALGAAFVLFRRSHGAGVAAGAAALLATSPLFLGQTNGVVADLPFLALLLAGFHLLESAGRPARGDWARTAAGALALVAATWLRTAGLVVLPALLLSRAGGRESSRRFRYSVAALLLVGLTLPWMLRARELAASAVEPSEQLLLFSYSTALFHLDPGDPGSPLLGISDWLARLLDNGWKVAAAIAGSTTGSSSGFVLVLVLAVLLCGAAIAWRAGPSLLDLFALAYTGLLLVYFTFDRRLLLPLLPALGLYALLGLELVARKSAVALGRSPSRGRLLAGSALVLVTLQTGQLLAARFVRYESPDTRAARTLEGDQRRIAAWIAAETVPGARIVADQAPVLAWLSGRRVYTHRYARGVGLFDRCSADFVIVEPSTAPAVRAEAESRGAPYATIELARGAGPTASARVYRWRGRATALFYDGFEAGDAAAWPIR